MGVTGWGLWTEKELGKEKEEKKFLQTGWRVNRWTLKVVQEVLKRLCIKLLVMERNLGNKRKCNMKAHVNADQYRLSSRDQHNSHKHQQPSLLNISIRLAYRMSNRSNWNSHKWKRFSSKYLWTMKYLNNICIGPGSYHFLAYSLSEEIQKKWYRLYWWWWNRRWLQWWWWRWGMGIVFRRMLGSGVSVIV